MSAFLLAVGTLAGLAAALALALVAVERLFGRSGPATIAVNGEEPGETEAGEPLLSALRGRGLFLPSACGGRGSCGMCKVKVTAGAGPLLPTERPHLTDAEIADGVRLACQLKARGAMALEVPRELLSVREYPCRVVAVERLNHDTVRVRLALPEGSGFSFAAGQYVQFATPIYDGLPEPVQRAYSIASPPTRAGEIELIIRKVFRGIATTYVHELLAAEDVIAVNGPYGEFRLRETGAEALFIAGGSGIAPFEAILADMAEHKTAKKATLFFGAVERKDFYDLEKLAAYETLLPHFRFIPVLGRPAPEDGWTGATGLVTEALAAHAPSLAGIEAYLCGSPGMIDACRKVLAEKGVGDDAIFYDKFS